MFLNFFLSDAGGYGRASPPRGACTILVHSRPPSLGQPWRFAPAPELAPLLLRGPRWGPVSSGSGLRNNDHNPNTAAISISFFPVFLQLTPGSVVYNHLLLLYFTWGHLRMQWRCAKREPA